MHSSNRQRSTGVRSQVLVAAPAAAPAGLTATGRAAPRWPATAALALALAIGGAASSAVAQNQPAGAQRNPGVIELMNQVESLNAELNRIRGELEVLNNGLENAQRRQRDMYLDLDTRLRRLEGSPDATGKAGAPSADVEARLKRLEEAAAHGGKADGGDLDARLKRLEAAVGGGMPANPAPGATPSAPPTVPASAPSSAPVVVTPTPPVPPTAPSVAKPATTPATPSASAPPAGASNDIGSARRAYDNALATYRAGDFQGAIAGFDALVKRYPKDPLAPNAQYWIGDAWFNLRDFRAAANAQQALIANYPDSPKAPDAMLNLSSAQLALGENPAARRTLEDLIARFPQSDAAEKARQRLAKLK